MEKVQKRVEHILYLFLVNVTRYYYSSCDLVLLLLPRETDLEKQLRSLPSSSYHSRRIELLCKSPRRFVFRLFLWFLLLSFFSFFLVLGLKLNFPTPATTVSSPSTATKQSFEKLCATFNDSQLLSEIKDLRVMVAVNLKDVEHLLPVFSHQILRLREYLKPENIFVSMYESGSCDRSQVLLQELEAKLTEHEIQHRFVFGNRTRKKGENRIKFLAEIRNQVLSVLDENIFEPDYILFSNDVFFCTEHLIRLLYRSTKGGDMVCALDFNEEYHFYDTWVARDSHGMPLRHSRDCSVFSSESDVRLCRQGMAVPMHCCWNGLVVFRSSIFTRKGIRFRHVEDEESECAGSECTLLCNDLWKNGFRSIYVDPGVRVAYEARIFRDLEVEKPVLNEKAFSVMKEQQLVPFQPPDKFFCCPLPPQSSRDDPNLNVAYFASVL
ncbi:hypothetical protein GAYE_SCF63G6640 [Galdieria yellowstonensis]|uniref:Alpha-1,3-mannosyltransferase n=1 Tax=Galdieria yellowstonensis TaxID=3028027 RepID=A0AAV9IMN0_9RHOD|nr:hypothetical protein GAYE_SCF63G6640 [Galdieria yellowstonensis]